MKRGKKAEGSHFEVIISFVLFFVFIAFLLAYIKPVKSNYLTSSIVSELHDSFEKQVLINYTKLFLKAETSSECFSIEISNDISLWGLNGRNILSFDAESAEEVNSSLTLGKINIQGDSEFYNIIISEDLNEKLPDVSCDDLNQNNFIIGSIDEKQVVSYNKLKQIETRYNNNYEQLKKDMNFPEAFDFAVISDIINIEKIIPQQGEIYANDYIEEVLYPNATLINKRFTLVVW